MMDLTRQKHRQETQASESSFDHLADQVWNMMQEMKEGDFFRSHAAHSWHPRVNLYETTQMFFVCVELAGMPRKDIDVRADDGVLHIVGVRHKPTLPEDVTNVSVYLMEIDSGRFHRKVPIPEDAQVDAIRAVYRHGYLWVMIPRATSPS